jgi:lysozyme
MEKVPGNDVSEHQGEIDWPKVYADGQRFVFIKATEGDYRHDKTFLANWVGAKSAGLLRGAYHFFRCDVDATTQADYFIDFVKSTNDNGELPPCLDLETNEGKTKGEIIPMVKVWLDRVEGAFGRKPIIYSGKYKLQDYLSEPNLDPPVWAKDYALWLAGYTPEPVLPQGWSNWTFWQYTNEGSVNGVNGNVDMDFFNGSLESLHRFAGSTLAKTTSSTAQKLYTVKAGDTLNSIAIENGTTQKEIAALNNLVKATDISIGKVLKLPYSIQTQTTSSTPQKTYTVKSGDTLNSIAIENGTTQKEIAALNNLAKATDISVGKVLKLP